MALYPLTLLNRIIIPLNRTESKGTILEMYLTPHTIGEMHAPNLLSLTSTPDTTSSFENCS